MTTKRRNSLMITTLLCAPILLGCSIHASKGGEGDKNKDVDIRSPFGSISVHSGRTDAKDLGLPIYPGARPTQGHGDNEDNANVNISSPVFGVKVVVQSYETDDPPEKVLDFYQKPMGKFGTVIQCSGGSIGGFHHHRGKDTPVSCDSSGSGYEKELKVGTEDNQHVVAVKPRGKGSEFTLVYVRAREETDKDTI